MTESDRQRVRAPRRDAAENHEALIMAAASALNRDPNASLEAIAAEAGLSRRAFYGHFANRDVLLRELALHGAARINAALLGDEASRRLPLSAGSAAETAQSPENGSVRHGPAAELAALGLRLWHEVEHVQVMALITVRGPQSALVGDALEPLRSRVRAIVARGVDDGVFRRDIPLETLTRLIESAAISVLDESTRHRLSSGEGGRLVALSALSMAGLSAEAAASTLQSIPAPEATR